MIIKLHIKKIFSSGKEAARKSSGLRGTADAVPVDTGRLLNVLCTFNLRPVSTGFELVETII